MKFLHLADLHLGKSVSEFSMIRDQEAVLDLLFTLAKEEKADAVLISGDVYDKAIPSEEAVHLLDSFLNRLSQENISVLIISGNHDSDERLNFGSSLFSARGVYIAGKYEGSLQKVTLKDAQGEVDFWMLPFVKASLVRHYLPEADIESYDDAVRAAISACQPDPDRRNVLLAHQFVTGHGQDPEMAGSENQLPQAVGTIEKVGWDAFEAFDYVALGHIHTPQMVGRETIRYAGSPLKYSLSEIRREKSVPVVTLGKKGETDIRLVPITPLRDMRRIKGKLDELLDAALLTEDYIYATLTDEEIIPDAVGHLRTYYPNLMKLDYANSHTRAVMDFSFRDQQEKVSFKELMTDFYQKIRGGDISEQEWDILKGTAKEAGLIDETD
ncbi:MAG: exonuclease SbcCD subunit D [Firmicutes bacterium]|nr:exonuclease SbcCD subunit D [Bacillota bacterium]